MNKMMNKIGAGLLALTAAASLLMVTGCDESDLTPEQIKAVSQQVGFAASVGWIALDNPDREGIDAVVSILDVINESAGEVKQGSTYSEVIYPKLEVIIKERVDAQYRPLAMAGSIQILRAIDLLFANNPEWKENQDLAIGVVESFVRGTKAGFSLKESDPIIVQARAQAAARAKVYSQQ
jgi:hypothetical protein